MSRQRIPVLFEAAWLPLALLGYICAWFLGLAYVLQFGKLGLLEPSFSGLELVFKVCLFAIESK